MNYGILRYIFGCLLQFEAAFLVVPAIVGICYREYKNTFIYLAVALICLLLGTLLRRKRPKHSEVYLREGFASVALSWLIMSIFGAIPFVLTGDIPHYIDALFETISGFTTTGASILPDVEALSYSGLFWRSFTHWIGGMGVFVLIMAILPMMGGSTMNLMRAESPGPSVSKLLPKVRDTAKILYELYIAITIIGIIVLCICGMPLFDSLTTTFGAVGTGGFSIHNDSLASYSPLIQIVVGILMILSGINYSFYFFLLLRQFKNAFTMEEIRWYILIIISAIGIITWDIHSMYTSLGESIRHAFVQVSSLITSTGFVSVDYDTWPQLSKTVLIIVMFIGACAGSTGGGIKVSRILILLKAIKKELLIMIHPRMVRKIKMDGHIIPHETLRSTNVFISVYFVVMFASILLIGIDEYDFTTNFTSVLATLNNMGPGMALAGPTENFSIFSPFSKCILMFDMLAGRLELFPMLIILFPACWKKY